MPLTSKILRIRGWDQFYWNRRKISHLESTAYTPHCPNTAQEINFSKFFSNFSKTQTYGKSRQNLTAEKYGHITVWPKKSKVRKKSKSQLLNTFLCNFNIFNIKHAQKNNKKKHFFVALHPPPSPRREVWIFLKGKFINISLILILFFIFISMDFFWFCEI